MVSAATAATAATATADVADAADAFRRRGRGRYSPQEGRGGVVSAVFNY